MPDPVSTGSGARAAKARHSQPGTNLGSTPEDENVFDINDPVQVQGALDEFEKENGAQHEKIQNLEEELLAHRIQADQYKSIIAKMELRLSKLEREEKYSPNVNDPAAPIPSNPRSRGRSSSRLHDNLPSKPRTRSPSLHMGENAPPPIRSRPDSPIEGGKAMVASPGGGNLKVMTTGSNDNDVRIAVIDLIKSTLPPHSSAPDLISTVNATISACMGPSTSTAHGVNLISSSSSMGIPPSASQQNRGSGGAVFGPSRGRMLPVQYTAVDCLRDITPDSYLTHFNPFNSIFRLLRKGNKLYSSHLTSLERRDQWQAWDSSFRAHLASYNILGFILDPGDDHDSLIVDPAIRSVPRPSVSSPPTEHDLIADGNWIDVDEAISSLLSSIISHPVRTVLVHEIGLLRKNQPAGTAPLRQTAKITYSILRRRYGVGDIHWGADRWQEAVMMSCGSDVAKYLEDYLQIARQVELSGHRVSYIDMVETFLFRLPRYMGHVVQEFRTWSTSDAVLTGKLDFSHVVYWVDKAVVAFHAQRSTARRLMAVRSQPAGVSPRFQPRSTAAAPASASIASSSSTTTTSHSSSRPPGARPFAGVCRNCGQTGHTQANCTNPPNGHRSRVGHSMGPRTMLAGDGEARIEEVEEQDGTGREDDVGEVAQVVDVENAEMDALFAAEDVFEGLLAGSGDAYAVDADLAAAVTTDYRSLSIDTSVPTYDNSTLDRCYFLSDFAATVSAMGSPCLALSVDAERRRLMGVWDSGCTQDIVNVRHVFHSFRPICMAVGTANKQPLMVQGIGTVRFPLRFADGSVKVITLLDCLYAPDCPVNLLSVGRLVDRVGLRVLFDEARTICWEHNPTQRPRRVAVMPRVNHLTMMRLEFIPPPPKLSRLEVSLSARGGAVDTVFRPSPLTVELWHRRLNHMGWEGVKNVLRGKAVVGVEYVGSLESMKCVACIEGKGARLPYANPRNRADRVGDLVHMDICGPMPVECEGNRYFLSILDDASNFAWVFLLKSKDQSTDEFRKVDNWLENRTGRRIGSVRMDGAKEFTEGRMREYMEGRGIARQVVAPYAHQQNGKAERYIGRMENDMRTLMAASGLKGQFWGYAVLTANHVANRTPTSVLPPDVTPFEVVFGSKPDISYFRPFGVRCFPLIPAEIRPKLHPFRVEAIFLGYESERVGWRVMRVSNRKVVFSNDVIWDEGNYGRLSKLTSSTSTGPSAPGVTPAPILRRSVRLNAAPDGGVAVFVKEKGHVVGVETRAGTTVLNQGGNMVKDDEIVDERKPDVVEAVSVPMGVHPVGGANRGSRVEDGVVGAMMTTAEDGALSPDEILMAKDHILSTDAIAMVLLLLRAQAVGDQGTPEPSAEFHHYSIWAGVARLFDDDGEGSGYNSARGSMARLDINGCSLSSGQTSLGAWDLTKPPESYFEAMSRPDSHIWIAAMQREFDSLKARGAFIAVAKPDGVSLIGLRWVYDFKYNPDGSIQWGNEKARLVAQGFAQRPDSYDETYAPVARLPTIRIVFASAAAWDWHIFSFDVKTAFLHSKLKSEVYVRQIPGFPEADPSLVLKLLVALYGLKQAAFAWFCHFIKVLVKIGLKQCSIDPAFFIGNWASPPHPSIPMPADGSNLQIMIPIHVDDGLSATNSEPLYKWIIAQLGDHGIQVKDMGSVSMFLGWRVFRDRPSRRLWLSQAPMVMTLLQEYKMDPCQASAVPMDKLPSDWPEGKNAVLVDAHLPRDVFIKKYQSIVGSITYLAMSTRADLAFSAMALGHHSSDPQPKHMAAAKQVLRYLWGTRNHVLMFDSSRDVISPRVDSQIRSSCGFSDADWASDSKTRLSVSGYIFYYHGGAISWSAKRQRVIALSSTEAEYYAITHAVREALCLRRFLLEMGLPIPSPFPMFMDSKSAISQIMSPAITARSKHIHIRELFIKHYFSDGSFVADWLGGQDNVADLFTKPLDRVKFELHRKAVGVVMAPA